MIERGSATEDDVIAAFLQAEIDASRYSEVVEGALEGMGWNRSLIDTPNLTNREENAARRDILAFYRGYPDNLLFRSFPPDVTWRRVELEPADFPAIRYANHPVLLKLSAGSRRIADGARIFAENPADHPDMAQIPAARAAFCSGRRFAPLILVQANWDAPVLIEGHTRATIYVMERFADPVDAFVGSSPSMSRWSLY
jgi:hypothetical protein